MTTTFKELLSVREVTTAIPVLHQLRPQFSQNQLLGEVLLLRNNGYRLYSLSEEEKVACVAGVSINYNLYDGRHMWIYDLVTDSKHRSKGYGEVMLSKLEEVARAENCGLISLSSGNTRVGAHRFYEEKVGYDKVSTVFKKNLD